LNPGFGRYRHVEAEAACAATLLANEQGRIIEADAAARAILARHGCVSRQRETLRFADRATRVRFAERLAELAEEKPGAVRALACACEDRLELLIERRGLIPAQLLIQLRERTGPKIRTDLLR